MEQQIPTTDLRTSVMDRIRAGSTTMRPAWHFALLAALWTVGLFIVTLVVILLFSFVLFTMRQSGVLAMPGLGLPGFRALVAAIPWLLILAGIIFVGILEALVRHFRFAYRRPLLMTLGVIVAVTLLGGFALSRTPMHERFFERALDDRLPVAGPMYRRFGMGGENRIHPGIIASVQGDIVTLATRRGEVLVRITGGTLLPDMPLTVGLPIIVLGDRDGASISAIGIQPALQDLFFGHGDGPPRF